MQSKSQLIELMGYYCDKGDYKNGRKIAQKLIQADSDRLKQLATIDIDNSNYRAVMDEINEIEYLTGI
jgi:hypothetical protein